MPCSIGTSKSIAPNVNHKIQKDNGQSTNWRVYARKHLGTPAGLLFGWHLRSPLVLPCDSPQEYPVLLREGSAWGKQKYLHFLHFLLAIGHSGVGHCRSDCLVCNSAISASSSLQPHLTVVSLLDSVGERCECVRALRCTCVQDKCSKYWICRQICVRATPHFVLFCGWIWSCRRP